MSENGAPEPLLAPSGEASVVLDVGGTKGAAVIFATHQMVGKEIEIRNVGTPWKGMHTGTRQRDLRDRVAFAGVFGSLPAGHYQLRVMRQDTEGCAHRSVVELAVIGGEVTQMEWPADSIRPRPLPHDAGFRDAVQERCCRWAGQPLP